jgi:carboxyl-terminal processing protease
MNALKKLTLPLALLIFVSLTGHALTDSLLSKPEEPASIGFTPLVPEREQRDASMHIARSLLVNHYRKQDFDRTFSAAVFDNYLKALDEQKMYLVQTDIDEFEHYRHQLHSALKNGQLDPGFVIYNRYLARLLERLEFQLEYLNAAEKVDFSVDEYILADREDAPWARDMKELKDIWRRRVKSALLSSVLGGDTFATARDNLIRRYENQRKRTLQMRSEDAFQVYMNAFTTVYDPHTNYFSPSSSENFNINMRLSLEGIGAVLQSDNEYTKVVRLVTGGPAEKQGQLRPADRIVGVGQGEEEIVNVIGWRLDEVVELIRGPKHSVVRLEVLPASSKLDTETRQIRILRDKVKLEEQAASSQLIETERNGQTKRIGVIQLPTFYADFQAMQNGEEDYKSTTRDVRVLLDELRAGAGIDGLVIDLRGNGGGSLDEANQLTGLFIDRGPTVQIRNANNRIEPLEDPDPSLVYSGPLVVLVDRMSASASEIFAGAIQDYGRGVIMGSRTFGKGTVQSVRPLNHGQLKITQAKFYRISGGSTQHRGVMPDIMIPDAIDPSKVGEDALDHALPWDSINAVAHPKLYDIGLLLGDLNLRHNRRFESNPEFKLLQEEIALVEQQNRTEQVSLNRKIREREIGDARAAQLALINKRRALKGEPPFRSFEQWEKDAEQKASENEDKKEVDFVMKEGAEVLLDFVELQSIMMTADAA